MFRQEEVFIGGWREKTIEAMQRRRFEQCIAQLPPLGALRLAELSPSSFERRLEQCWQDVERKPMRAQQLTQVWKSVLSSIDIQADCLSREEHELVERALILGGSVQIEDAQELEAARALSLRLWASVGLVSGKPVLELETPVLEPAARAFARDEHEQIRQQLDGFHAWLTGTLYRVGALDDRQPQQQLLDSILPHRAEPELRIQLARRYLWASCDCVDYSGGVMLVHSALADPRHLITTGRRRLYSGAAFEAASSVDILPEEIPLQQDLERAIHGALRSEYRAADAARSLRFLCKQGAPLDAMEDVLQSMLIVYLSTGMRGALANMYYRLPKWIESAEPDRRSALQ
ncbi:MAG: hypothetical protein IKU38_02945 [Clostridia bacterium]|nr:hypothetical protein [Clostridia bacterium]